MEAVTYIRSILIRINQLKYMKCKLPREVEHATILMSYKIEVKDMNLVYFNTAFLFLCEFYAHILWQQKFTRE